MNNNNDFRYVLQFKNGDSLVTHSFSADVDIDKMRDHLRDFLCGTSWFEEQVNKILGEDK